MAVAAHLLPLVVPREVEPEEGEEEGQVEGDRRGRETRNQEVETTS